jgi:hypothetical protein
MSKEAIEVQRRSRIKLATNAVEAIASFTGLSRDWKAFEESFQNSMSNIGYGLVILEGWPATAEIDGWTPQQIIEADRFVWDQLRTSCLTFPAAQQQLKLAGAQHSGSECYAGLLAEHGIMSYADEAVIRGELQDFGPTTDEDPIRMIARFRGLLYEYLLIPHAEPWPDDRCIRKVLSLVQPWTGLTGVVLKIQLDIVSGQDTSFTTVCHMIRAVWESFGKHDDLGRRRKVKVNAAKVAQDNQTGSSTTTDNIPAWATDFQAQLKVLTTQLKSKPSGRPAKAKPSTSSASTTDNNRNVKENKECLVVSCSIRFDGAPWMRVCKDCLQTAKDDRLPLSLTDGMVLTIEDSANPKHKERGG